MKNSCQQAAICVGQNAYIYNIYLNIEDLLLLLLTCTLMTVSSEQYDKTDHNEIIPALLPSDESGHHFVMYSDCCSGIPGKAVAKNLEYVNEMLKRIQPSPQFISFPGDAVKGYTNDSNELQQQWDYWLNIQMNWIRERNIPLYQSTSNHNTYDDQSEAVFRETHLDLPQNGPVDQIGLAYWFRRKNFLYVSTHQPDQQMLINHHWLDRVLSENEDAQFKFVVGHYPVFPVNGYTAWPLWCFPPNQRRRFWDLLVKHNVNAYLTSHIIAFDVQAHDGVLQILSGGAGTIAGPGGLMPGCCEYHHAVQMAVDEQGLRYQVHDQTGQLREHLNWPFNLSPVEHWEPIDERRISDQLDTSNLEHNITAFRIRGLRRNQGNYIGDETLVCGIARNEGAEPIWIGFDQDQLQVRIVTLSGSGWQYWHGPQLSNGSSFDFQIALHPAMGPGGILFRTGENTAWSSLPSTSSRGLELARWPQYWSIAYGQNGPSDRPFKGEALKVTFTKTNGQGI